MMEFSASYDRSTKIVSAVSAIVLLGAGLAAVRFTPLGWIGPAILLLSYIYSPRGYEVNDKKIVVRRWIGNLRIPLSSVREIRGAEPNDLRNCIRLWGSGALFGYYGLFRTSALGNAWWYVTNRANCVVVGTSGKTFVVSPDDVDGFVNAVRSTAPAVNHQWEPAVTGDGPGKIVAGVVVALGIAFVVGAFLYSPGAPGYTLTPDHLSIHDRFYPVTLNADSVDVAGMKVVNLKTDNTWHPVMRVGGFANSHYRSGWFRVAGGEKVRLYQAGSQDVVLLPPKGGGAPVLYQTAEPEQFIAEVRREWNYTQR